MAFTEQPSERRGPVLSLGRTRYVRVASCPWAELGTDLPARGSAMPGAYITGSDGDAAALLQDYRVDRADVGARVTLIYDRLQAGTGGPALPATWTLLEIGKESLTDTRRGRWITVLIEVPAAVTEEEIEATIPPESAYPGLGGVFAPTLRRYRLRSAFRQGKSLLTLHYEPPTWREILRKNPGRGVLLVDVSAREVPAIKQLGKETSTADDAWVNWDSWTRVDGVKVHRRWRPVRGRATVSGATILLKLAVVASNPDIQKIAALVRTTNDRPLPRFGPMVGAKTLRFRGSRVSRELVAEAYYFTEWLLELFPDGWDKETYVQRQLERVYREAVYDPATGTAIPGRYENVADWEDVGASYPAKLLQPADWSVIDRMIGW